MAVDPETELELAARRLEGARLRRVVYLDPFDGGGFASGHPAVGSSAEAKSGTKVDRGSHPDGDRVGLAMFLELATDRIVCVRWSDDFGLRHGFGVTLSDVALIDGDQGRLDDVTPRWIGAIGRPITRASIRWRSIEEDLRGTFKIGIAIHADHLSRRDYPAALELDVGDRRISIETGFQNHLIVRFA